MTILRNASVHQSQKLNATLNSEQLISQDYSCSSECWDCDGCGGSITH